MKTMLAVLGAGAALLAAPAFAHDNGWHYGHRHGHHGFYAPRPVVVVPAPRVVYAPAPRYYYRPAPVYYRPAPVYYPPAPAYYPPAPVHYPSSGISIRFNLPL